jgi:hypothetical protein
VRYRLSRPSQDEYLAELNIQFEPAERDQEFREKAGFV